MIAEPPLIKLLNSHPSPRERQCRELWKLRAALHDDCCVGDDWANYHQRLNRRYDSGYKSIEKQLSSSLEGNVFAASNLQAAAPAIPSDQVSGNSPVGHSDPPHNERPQSGCSGQPVMIGVAEQPGEQLTMSDSTGEDETIDGRQSRRNSLDGKLAALDLDDVPLENLLSQLVDRDCQSRSSSNDRDEKTD